MATIPSNLRLRPTPRDIALELLGGDPDVLVDSLVGIALVAISQRDAFREALFQAVAALHDLKFQRDRAAQ